jgi:hypothetical protein
MSPRSDCVSVIAYLQFPFRASEGSRVGAASIPQTTVVGCEGQVLGDSPAQVLCGFELYTSTKRRGQKVLDNQSLAGL